MHRCGITIDRANHDAAYAFIKRGTGENGYVWYGDSMGGGPNNWADMGRTGAAAIAYFLSPYADAMYRERALLHARVIGLHPQSFPDTHGSPAMGMGYSALGAAADPESFRKLMDANRWWFTMAQCTDGSFYYQPNRDNAGYGSDSRMTASSVTAFMLSIHKRGLVLTGREQKVAPPPVRKAAAGTKPLTVYILAGQSNMQGHAAISTFDSLATDPETAPLLMEMRTPDGAPRTCQRVWISSIGCLGDAYSDLTEAKGKLTAGFGAPEDKIGPEFTFGIFMEKAVDAPILIIKTAWGGANGTQFWIDRTNRMFAIFMVQTQRYRAPTYNTFQRLVNEAAGVTSRGGGLDGPLGDQPAGESPERGAGPAAGARPRQAFNRLDADGNGSLSRQEYDGSPLAERADFATADADGDGVVSFEEALAVLRRR